MSLFYIDEADELNELVQRMSKRQYERSPELYDGLPERAKRFMKRDFFYGISYLKSALDLKEEHIYLSYVKWTYEYLSYLMTYVPREQMHKQCMEFYIAMEECLEPELPGDEYALAKVYIEDGLKEMERLYKEGFTVVEYRGKDDIYEQKISEYIALILSPLLLQNKLHTSYYEPYRLESVRAYFVVCSTGKCYNAYCAM